MHVLLVPGHLLYDSFEHPRLVKGVRVLQALASSVALVLTRLLERCRYVRTASWERMVHKK